MAARRTKHVGCRETIGTRGALVLKLLSRSYGRPRGKRWRCRWSVPDDIIGYLTHGRFARRRRRQCLGRRQVNDPNVFEVHAANEPSMSDWMRVSAGSSTAGSARMAEILPGRYEVAHSACRAAIRYPLSSPSRLGQFPLQARHFSRSPRKPGLLDRIHSVHTKCGNTPRRHSLNADGVMVNLVERAL